MEMAPGNSHHTAALVQEWLSQFGAALHEVRLLELQAGTKGRQGAYAETIAALECVLAALCTVSDYASAKAACNALQRKAAALRASGGWSHQIDEAIRLLVDEVLLPFAADATKDPRKNAVALLRARIPPADRYPIHAAMTSSLTAFCQAHHMGMGMAVRNVLRNNGFDEHRLGIDSLDEEWPHLLWEAVHETESE